jgi:hypothetical protein
MTLRVFLLLFCAIIVRFTAMAQIEVGGVYFPSITVISQGDHDSNPYVKNKLTFAGGAGVTFGYTIKPNFVITSGILYASHNQKFDGYATIADSTFKIYSGKKRLDYLKVPVLFKFMSAGDKGPFKYYGFVGPQFAFLLKGDGATVVYEHYDNGYFFDLPPANNKYYNPFIIELSAGVGADYQLADNLYLQTSLKFDAGLNNTENKAFFNSNYYNKSDHTSDNHNTRNYSLNLMIGVSYHLSEANALIHPHGKSRTNGIKYK